MTTFNDVGNAVAVFERKTFAGGCGHDCSKNHYGKYAMFTVSLQHWKPRGS